MTISALKATVVVSFFENGQLNLTKLFTLEELNREQVDILRNFKGRLALIGVRAYLKIAFSSLGY